MNITVIVVVVVLLILARGIRIASEWQRALERPSQP
jgi:hypothetical protein